MEWIQTSTILLSATACFWAFQMNKSIKNIRQQTKQFEKDFYKKMGEFEKRFLEITQDISRERFIQNLKKDLEETKNKEK